MIKHVKPQGTYLTWLDVSAIAEQDQREGAGRGSQQSRSRQCR